MNSIVEVMSYSSYGFITRYKIEKNLFVKDKFRVYINLLHGIEYYPRRTVTDKYESHTQYIGYDCWADSVKFIQDNIVLYTEQIMREPNPDVLKEYNLQRWDKQLITGNSLEDIYSLIGYEHSNDQDKVVRLEILEQIVQKK